MNSNLMQFALASASAEGEGILPLQWLGVFFGCLGLLFFLGTAVGMLPVSRFLHPDACCWKRGYLVHHAHVDWFRSFHDG